MSKNSDGHLYVYRGGQGEIIEKKSRFIATVKPVKSEEEAVSFINEIAKEALRLAAQKLPITTKFVVRRDYDIQNQNA